jgi:predicted RNase H-like nuclease
MKITIKRGRRHVAGIDGCRGGWCLAIGAVATDSIRIKCQVISTFADAVAAASGASDIAVDIPIGLTESGARACDQIARRALGSRWMCVFRAPPRPVLATASYAEANMLNRSLYDGKGMSQQAYCIKDKIAEVDRYLRANPGSPDRIWEVHPELCFKALNEGAPVLIRKGKPEGLRERRALLSRLVIDLEQTIDQALESAPRSVVKEDDVLDAIVGCVTAATWSPESTVQATDGDRDAYGLPMQMRCPAS